MDSQQLVIDCITGKEPERTPVMIVGQGYTANKMHRLPYNELKKSPKMAANSQIKFLEETRLDGLEVVYDYLTPVEACGSKVVEAPYSIFPTVEPVLRKIDKVYDLGPPDPMKDSRFTYSLTMANILLNQVGSQYFSYSTIAGPFTLSAELRGIPSFLFESIIEPELTHKIMDLSKTIIMNYLAEHFKLDTNGIFIADPISSGTFITVTQYNEFEFHKIYEISKHCKDNEKKVILHVCGDSNKELSSLPICNIDIVSVDKYVKLPVAESAFLNKTIMGNLPSDGPLSYGTKEEAYEECCMCLELMRGRRHILSSGCGVPLDANMENLKMLRVASENYSMMCR